MVIWLSLEQVYPKAIRVIEATFKCGKKSQIMRYHICRKWQIVRSYAPQFFKLCGICAMDSMEFCENCTVNWDGRGFLSGLPIIKPETNEYSFGAGRFK
jgi:hypothetical protein